MRKAAVEQVRLEARAQAFRDAVDSAKFAKRCGQDIIDELELTARITDQAVEFHVTEHGRWCP